MVQAFLFTSDLDRDFVELKDSQVLMIRREHTMLMEKIIPQHQFDLNSHSFFSPPCLSGGVSSILEGVYVPLCLIYNCWYQTKRTCFFFSRMWRMCFCYAQRKCYRSSNIIWYHQNTFWLQLWSIQYYSSKKTKFISPFHSMFFFFRLCSIVPIRGDYCIPQR